MERVDAGVAEDGGDAGKLRVVAPADARIVGVASVGMVAVGELGDDQANPAEIAAPYHGAGVAD